MGSDGCLEVVQVCRAEEAPEPAGAGQGSAGGSAGAFAHRGCRSCALAAAAEPPLLLLPTRPAPLEAQQKQKEQQGKRTDLLLKLESNLNRKITEKTWCLLSFLV